MARINEIKRKNTNTKKKNQLGRKSLKIFENPRKSLKIDETL